MGWIILILLGIGLAVYPQVLGYRLTIAPLVTRVIGVLIALAALVSTSYTIIEQAPCVSASATTSAPASRCK